MEEKYYKLDQEEYLELGDESGKLVFLNHINKQTKIPRNSKKKSIKNPLKKWWRPKINWELQVKKPLKTIQKKNPEKIYKKAWKHSKKSLKNPGKNDVIKCKWSRFKIYD